MVGLELAADLLFIQATLLIGCMPRWLAFQRGCGARSAR